jgi:hypothetical protein
VNLRELNLSNDGAARVYVYARVPSLLGTLRSEMAMLDPPAGEIDR